ncbi:MAG: hypothetical protein V2I46_09360 [Bacteroides sp.]|jgi:hypothetical protein|nr:hypothetical protein [Bacteroides sp.]
MKKNFFTGFVGLLIVLSMITGSRQAQAWSEHPLIIYPILKNMPVVANAPEVEVKSLLTFLLEEEEGLARLLGEQEAWSRANFEAYAARPGELAFAATGNAEDILQRFFYAIRINPNAKMALYQHLPPGVDGGGREPISPYELTTLDKLTEMLQTTYLKLNEGEMIAPILVLASANNEPDYGFDLGLFEDNNTYYGKVYGFGEQTFGNPNLPYGSQAPFHMGFYHESKIVFAAAPFLKRTYVEYRIHLYKTLASYAFSVGQDYWGYRFMGWAMHYLSDLSMPYHSSVLPGVSTLRMIWINLKSMLGLPRAYDNAVQLVSNRHTVYEQFQWLVLRGAYESGNWEHPFFKALENPVEEQAYYDWFPREVVAKESKKRGKPTTKVMEKSFPKVLVSDPAFEVSGSDELENLIAYMTAEKGPEAVDAMTELIAERFSAYSMHNRSFIRAMLGE